MSILRVRVRLEIKLELGLGLLTRPPLPPSRERYDTRVGGRTDLADAFPFPCGIAVNDEAAAAAVRGTTFSVKILIVLKCCFMSVAKTTWGEPEGEGGVLIWER